MKLTGWRASKEAAQRQRDLVVAYKQVFSSPEGKEVLFDLMNRHHILNPHDGGPGAEGERKVVLRILQNLNINPAVFDEMLKGEVE